MWLAFVLIGLLASAILLAIAYFLQNKWALAAMGGVVVVTAILVTVDATIVTEKEAIRQTIFDLAEAVGRNDVKAAVQYVSPTATQCVNDVETEMPRYDFDVCAVRRIDNFEIDRSVNPPQATVEFRVLVKVGVPHLGFSGTAPRVVQLNFRKEGDRWLIYDYDHWEPPEFARFTGGGNSRDDLYPQ